MVGFQVLLYLWLSQPALVICVINTLCSSMALWRTPRGSVCYLCTKYTDVTPSFCLPQKKPPQADQTQPRTLPYKVRNRQTGHLTDEGRTWFFADAHCLARECSRNATAKML